MSAFFTIVSSTPTSSLTVIVADAEEALRRYDALADSKKRRIATFDDAGAELSRDDLLHLSRDGDRNTPHGS